MHPAGVGLWLAQAAEGPHPRRGAIARGHTARQAFDASGLRQAGYGFNELTFELVADVAPALESAPPLPEQPRRRRAVRKPVGRLVGAERGASEGR